MSPHVPAATGAPGTAPAVFATHPLPRVHEVCAGLRARGLQAWPLPAFALEPVDAHRLAAVAAGLDAYRWLVMVSPTAVDVFATALGGRGLPPDCRVALIGRGSLDALEARGIRPGQPVLLPAGRADAATLLADPALQAVRGSRVLLVRGEQGSEAIASTLRAREALVDETIAYRRGPAGWPSASVLALEQGCATRASAAFAFTVSDAADSVAQALAARSAALWQWARRQRALAVHPRIVARCIQAGWLDARPVEPGTAALAAALESG